MITRYSMMSAGVTSDPITKQAYPDTLTKNYNDFVFTSPPWQVEPSEQFEQAPFITTTTFYQQPYYEDIILNINGINYISQIFDHDVIKFPISSDISTFMRKTT